MIAIQSIEDILDADKARREAGVPPVLTPEGRTFLLKLLLLMRPLQLTQVPAQTLMEL